MMPSDWRRNKKKKEKKKDTSNLVQMGQNRAPN